MIDHKKLNKVLQPGALSDLDIEILVPELEKLDTNDTYLEIGVDRGRSLSLASHIIKKPLVFKIGIDPALTPELKRFLNRTKDDLIVFINKESADAEREWKGISIKLLFLDGNHAYEFVKKDLEIWYPHMEKGGVMLFHDYDLTSPGVVRAVDEFAKKHGLKLEKPGEINPRSSIARIQLD